MYKFYSVKELLESGATPVPVREGMAALEARVLELEQALHECLVYCPEYMHGLAKKEYQSLLKGKIQ